MDATFVKGLMVLEALAASDEPCGVSDLSRQLGLTKSNVHRLLQTLVGRGYARNRGGSGRYELTLRIWELGVGVITRLDVKRVAFEYMEHLAHVSGETVHLSILDGGEVVYVAKVDSPQPVRAYTEVGRRAPAYCVATGKAMLAAASDEVVNAVAHKLRRYTSTTLISEDDLKAELRRIRALGYATNKGEWREGVWGLAAPVRDARNVVVAAIGISGPVERLKPRVLKQLAPVVVRAADDVSTRLGYSPERETENEAGDAEPGRTPAQARIGGRL